MANLPKRGLAARKALVALILAVIVLAIISMVLQNRPWTVPDEAKQRQNPLQPSDAAQQSARSVYSEKCASCHGDTGKGDGPDASSHNPAPSDFTDRLRLRTETDGELFYKITEGHKPMPSFKKRLTEEQRWRLVLLIRSFASPSALPGGTSTSAPNASSTHP